MKNRYLVSRCCCKDQVAPPVEPTIVQASGWGYYDHTTQIPTTTYFTETTSARAQDTWLGKVGQETVDPNWVFQGFLEFENLNISAISQAQLDLKVNGFNYAQIGSFALGADFTVVAPGTYRVEVQAFLEDVDAADTTPGDAATMNARPRTTASSTYSWSIELIDDPPPDGITDRAEPEVPQGQQVELIDITAPLQEVLARPGWAPNNRIRVLIDCVEANTDEGDYQNPIGPQTFHWGISAPFGFFDSFPTPPGVRVRPEIRFVPS